MKRFLILLFFSVFGLTANSYAQTVYASDKGEKFHTADCRLSGDAKDITWAAAKKSKKSPCAICKPEEHFKDKTVQCEGKTADNTRCKRMTADMSKKCFQHKSK